ncbi:MAG: ATP-binding protein [Salibacter sp.]|uniref:ATP-binding protein n=1 Tax=Salibacter sp. TaxID=2010995 RepID=UPI002870625D|nr:ATP-binding protein [Salibacter sp.]MDR9399652.1 ATP-binding protein [Salibacter sp.]
MITRKYSKQVLEIAEQFPVIGILGPRQVGKTTLAKQIMKSGFKKCIYLDLEKPSDYGKLSDPEWYFASHRDKCIIIDEIQTKPGLFKVLRSEVDEHKTPARFIMLGSASPDIVRESSESLAGRVSYIHMSPFTIDEIDEIDLRKLHFLGGFPDSILALTEKKAKNWLENFIKTYIERDLPLLGMPTSPITTRRLWEMLAWQNGNLLNLSAIGNSLGITYHTVKNYMDFIEGSFMIQTLRPFSSNKKKSLVKSPKIYLTDTGILHRLLKIPDYDSLLGMPIAGASFEAFVLQQLTANKPEDTELFFYRTRGGTEIDFVITRAGKAIASVEAKFSTAPKITKSMRNGIKGLDTTKNFIVTPQSEPYMKSENIMVCGISHFIQHELPNLSAS